MTDKQKSLPQQADEAATAEKTTRQGAKKLLDAADMILARDHEEIAEALSESGKSGHIQSIKFLYELAERSIELLEGEEESGLLRQAREWAAELASQQEDSADDKERRS